MLYNRDDEDGIQLITDGQQQGNEASMGRHACCHKQKLKKGLWSPEEDDKLVRYITQHGHGCWSAVPRHAGRTEALAP